MNQVGGQNTQRLKLVNQLKLIEDLWQKLYYVKWNPKSFAMLGRLARDMVGSAQEQGEQRVLDLVLQMEQHVKECAYLNTVPTEVARQRLSALIDALRFTLSIEGVVSEEPRTRPLLTVQPEIFLIVPGNKPTLATKLEDTGYRVRHLATLAEAEEQLHGRILSALVIDVDFPEGPEAVYTRMTALRAEVNFRAPIVYLAQRNDMVARLEALRAGSSAYFNKPVDNDEIVTALRELLLPQTAQGFYRVLIINDRPTEAWEIAGALEEYGITPRVVIQPLQILQDIHRFRPDSLLIDLDLKEVAGTELAQVLSQHREYDTLPMILMCFPADMAHYLENLEVPGASLLIKPVSMNHLCWEVKQRLRRARTLRVKVSVLTDNDAVSGLYNRRRFMMLLEREMEAIGLRRHNLTVFFIVLDNLRNIRDSVGVATADEVVGQAASRLRNVLSADQVAARFSDAVFAVLAPDLRDEAPIRLARRMRDALETGFYKVGEQALLLKTGIGIAMATDRSQDYLTLVQRADSACGLAREAKSERIYLQKDVAAVQQEQEQPSREQFLEEISELIEHEWTWLVFQPIVSMRGDARERYETLLRLRDRQGQEISPGRVFGVIQHHELGRTLDRWVIAHALDMLHQRRQDTVLFIKVLPVTLRDAAFSVWLREQLERTHVEAQHLVFQVAETTVERNLRHMFSFLGSIKMMGCGFCLDHFGRGTDSLGLLKNIGADYVKLDMHFIQNIAKDSHKQHQLREATQNLEGLGITPIICGIEDVQIMPILWSLGIDLIQGFFLQRPYREMSYDFSIGAF